MHLVYVFWRYGTTCIGCTCTNMYSNQSALTLDTHYQHRTHSTTLTISTTPTAPPPSSSLQMMGLLDSDTHPVRPEAIRKAMENLDTPRRVHTSHTHTTTQCFSNVFVSYLCLRFIHVDVYSDVFNGGSSQAASG